MTTKTKKTTTKARSAKAKTKRKPKAADAPKKASALDSAAKVLAEAKEPMTCKAMVEAMAEKGYWSSAEGKTPANTLYSAILREIGAKGKEARFKKTERGRFSLA